VIVPVLPENNWIEIDVMEDIRLPETVLNGPAEVGLAAAAGDAHEARFALPIGGRTDHALGQLAVPQSRDARARQLYYIAASTCRSREWYKPMAHTVGNVIPCRNEEFPVGHAVGREAIAAWVSGASATDVSMAVFLMLACKLCMWQFNHHVGQGAAIGFAAKALRFVFAIPAENAIDPGMVHDLWVMGHWVNTGSAWWSFGVTNLLEAYAPRGSADPIVADGDPSHPFAFPAPTRDITQRVEAGPAGTGKATVCRAIVKRASANAYSVLMPASAVYAELMALPEVIRSARHHVGAAHFTDGPFREIFAVAHEDAVTLAAFAYAALGGSSLARAPSLPSEAEARASDLYQAINRARLAMVAAPADERTIAMIGRLMGRDEGGDPMAHVRHALGLVPRVLVAPGPPPPRVPAPVLGGARVAQ